MTVLSLPQRGRYLPLHKHRTENQLGWTSRDRDDYYHMVETVEVLYKKGPAGLNIPRPLLETLWIEGITATQATNCILPYFVKCDSHRQNKVVPLRTVADQVEVLGLAAQPPTDFGIRFVVIGKGVERLSLQPWVLGKVNARRDTPMTEEELHTLEGRSDPTLIDVISKSDVPVTTSGEAKIVAVPAEAMVNLSRTHRGEFVREVARVWA